MIKQDKLYEEDEDGLIYWDEINQVWRNVYGNDISENQPPHE
jgi:hypothetical protein